MSDLLWPGDARAGDLFTDAAVLAAMVRVEEAWLAARGAPPSLAGLVTADDLPLLSRESEDGGNPVIPLLRLLRSRGAPDALHTGLTSQDVLDTALMLLVQDAFNRLDGCVRRQIGSLGELADRHRGTPMAARTLTQHAVPTTFGLKAAGWLTGVLDARDALAGVALPAQIGGAAGSLAAPAVVLGSAAGALDAAARAAGILGLAAAPPWHTARGPVTRAADAMVSGTDAWGKIANDVLLGSRPEVGELSESPAAGRGGSSAMPNKRNPVLAVLIRRAALAAPPLAATLHTAAANMIDERPDGAWHVEWATVRTLARRTVVAADQTAELLAGLRVDAGRMAATLAAARPGIDAERDKLGAAGTYRGATDEIIDAVLARAEVKPC